MSHHQDGDDEHPPKKKEDTQPKDLERVGNYNLGEDLINAGEGHDPAEDEAL